jgi:acyl-CoA thioesterase FadM
MEQNDGVLWVVREAKLLFHKPARLFDEVKVSCRALQVGKVKLLVEQNIYNGDDLLCTGLIKLATLDRHSYKLCAMPLGFREAVKS